MFLNYEITYLACDSLFNWNFTYAVKFLPTWNIFLKLVQSLESYSKNKNVFYEKERNQKKKFKKEAENKKKSIFVCLGDVFSYATANR